MKKLFLQTLITSLCFTNALYCVTEHKQQPAYESLAQKAQEYINENNLQDDLPQDVLFSAADNDRGDVIRYLHDEFGVNLDVLYNNVETALMRAVMEDSFDSLKMLITLGANINAQNNFYQTALQLASGYNKRESVKILAVAQNVDLNNQDVRGETALHNAVARDHIDIVKILVDAGADLNIQDEDGNTPLHIAIKYYYTEIVKILVDAGADINAQNNVKETPLQLAKRSKNKKIIKIVMGVSE